MDQIVVSLVTGLIKGALVLTLIALTAEVLGVPYEGLVAGLGVGGLALAIASRDTIANFIGAALFVADRPF